MHPSTPVIMMAKQRVQIISNDFIKYPTRLLLKIMVQIIYDGFIKYLWNHDQIELAVSKSN